MVRQPEVAKEPNETLKRYDAKYIEACWVEAHEVANALVDSHDRKFIVAEVPGSKNALRGSLEAIAFEQCMSLQTPRLKDSLKKNPSR